MWTTKITVNGAGDTSIELVLAKDLSPTIIQEVMKEPLRMLMTTGDVYNAMVTWKSEITARIIREPREYRDNKEKIMNLPWKSALALFAKIDEIYPFYEHVPPEYREPLRELTEQWRRGVESLRKS